MEPITKTLDGYKNYTFSQDGIAMDVTTSKEVKPNKKRMVALTDDKGETGVKNLDEIIKSLFPAPTSEGEKADDKVSEGTTDPEPTDAEKEVAGKLTELRKKVAAASKKLMTAKREDLLSARDEFDAVEKELEDFKSAHPSSASSKPKKATTKPEPPVLTDEQKAEMAAAQTKYDDAIAVYNDAKAKLEVATTELKKFKAVKSNSDHAPKIDYRTSQLIRQAYATGRFQDFPGEKRTVKEIADQYGVSSSAVGYYINYLQHKLNRKPSADTDMNDPENFILYTAFTPLVNEYYPLQWKSKDGVTRSGAPYAEDAVSEDNTRYTKPKAEDAPEKQSVVAGTAVNDAIASRLAGTDETDTSEL